MLFSVHCVYILCGSWVIGACRLYRVRGVKGSPPSGQENSPTKWTTVTGQQLAGLALLVSLRCYMSKAWTLQNQVTRD